MSNRKALDSIEIHTTRDGSPTLSISGGEKMHSMDGALSETLFIYEPVILKTVPLGRANILSMGLGLGYNEILTLGHLLKGKVRDFKILSFENQSILTDSFLGWGCRQEVGLLSKSYDYILTEVCKHLELATHNLRKFIQEALLEKKMEIAGALTFENSSDYLFHGILYDAFSNQSQPDLWSEKNLDLFIKVYCAPEICFFSTYAATGNIKRALKLNNFHVEKRKGFHKKRESTFARRRID